MTTRDMRGHELQEGDYVVIPTSRLVRGQNRILKVLDPHVVDDKPSFNTLEPEVYVRVQTHKVIMDNAGLTLNMRDPHPKETGSAETLPYNVKPQFLLKLEGNS